MQALLNPKEIRYASLFQPNLKKCQEVRYKVKKLKKIISHLKRLSYRYLFLTTGCLIYFIYHPSINIIKIVATAKEVGVPLSQYKVLRVLVVFNHGYFR